MNNKPKLTPEQRAENLRISREREHKDNLSSRQNCRTDNRVGMSREDEAAAIKVNHYQRFKRSANMCAIACDLWLQARMSFRPLSHPTPSDDGINLATASAADIESIYNFNLSQIQFHNTLSRRAE